VTKFEIMSALRNSGFLISVNFNILMNREAIWCKVLLLLKIYILSGWRSYPCFVWTLVPCRCCSHYLTFGHHPKSAETVPQPHIMLLFLTSIRYFAGFEWNKFTKSVAL